MYQSYKTTWLFKNSVKEAIILLKDFFQTLFPRNFKYMQVLANFLRVLFFHNSIKDNSVSESVLLLRLSSLYLCAKVGKLSSNIMCLLPLFTNNNPPFFKKAHFCSSSSSFSFVAFIEAAYAFAYYFPSFAAVPRRQLLLWVRDSLLLVYYFV